MESRKKSTAVLRPRSWWSAVTARTSGSWLHRTRANRSWTPDGTGPVYLSTDDSPHAPQINQVDLRTRRVRRLPTPANLLVADPRRHRNMLAFPVVGGRVDRIWTMAVNGTDAHPVGQPRFPVGAEGGRFALGDFDPRISPDGSRVAFMRHFAGDSYPAKLIGRRKDAHFFAHRPPPTRGHQTLREAEGRHGSAYAAAAARVCVRAFRSLSR